MSQASVVLWNSTTTINQKAMERTTIYTLPRILVLGVLLFQIDTSIRADQDYKKAFASYKSHQFARDEMDDVKLEKLAQLWSSAEDAENDSVDQSTLELANRNFSYRGVPINPLI
jgi:hypothetical protein